MKERTILTVEEALKRLMKICSLKEMCSYDLRKKMKLWDINDSNQDIILKKLAEDKFFSDERYAEAFINDKLKFQKWGKVKIKYSLRSKQIPERIIDNLMEKKEDKQYIEKLEELLVKKKNSLKSVMSVQEKKARLFRYASGKGFESEVIYEVMNKIIHD